MGQKVHPLAFRIGISKNWQSRWFDRKKYKELLRQDIELRDFIIKKLDKAGVSQVEIERLANSLRIIIHTARPGLVIGRGGSGVEDLRKEIRKIIQKQSPQLAESRRASEAVLRDKMEVQLEIEEIRKPESHAAIVAQGVADQIERRLPYRQVMKRTLDRIKQNKEVQGVKIGIKGRLNGADIARAESLKFGKIPLQTLRSNIDYAQVTAYTSYGTVGVKVWVYKGEVF